MEFHSEDSLRDHGIRLVVPGHAWVRKDVNLRAIARRGVVLHPGTRIEGAQTVIGEGAELGTHGPAYLSDMALGRDVRIASGSAEGSVMLDGSSLGPGAHVRPGCILEEQASTAHAVGIKQTILLAFATLGSNINFCDALLGGGRSRKDHSEVGSGFIHFNFTPFGPSGDKVTSSLFGDVPHSVTLDRDRIFLGGSGGVVGPIEVGFGTTLAAGGVYRRDYGAGLLVTGEELRPRAARFDFSMPRRVPEKVQKTTRYLGQLVALRTWYSMVRLRRTSDEAARDVVRRAIAAIELCIEDRITQVDRLLEAAKAHRRSASADSEPEESDRVAQGWREVKNQIADESPKSESSDFTSIENACSKNSSGHIEWVASLTREESASINRWLSGVADAVAAKSA